MAKNHSKKLGKPGFPCVNIGVQRKFPLYEILNTPLPAKFIIHQHVYNTPTAPSCPLYPSSCSFIATDLGEADFKYCQFITIFFEKRFFHSCLRFFRQWTKTIPITVTCRNTNGRTIDNMRLIVDLESSSESDNNYGWMFHVGLGISSVGYTV